MKKTLILILTICVGFTACNNQKTEKNENMNNPLLQAYDTPFGVPPFDKIKTEHYLPAIEACIEKHTKEIHTIINNKEKPNFKNTILAYDKSGEDLNRACLAFYCILSNNIDDEMQALAQKIFPMLSLHNDEISLNDKLFERIKTVYEMRHESNLDKYQIRVVEKYFDDFVRSGANLSLEDKETLKEINGKLSKLFLQFDENLLAETNSYKLYIDNKEDLAGLPENVIAAAAIAAKNDGNDGKWLFTTKKPSMLPFLQFSEKRELREKLYNAYYMRCNNDNENDNKNIINEITNLRVQKANLLGYRSFADYQISNNMAKQTNTVLDFITDIWHPALSVAKDELKELQRISNKEGNKFNLESWDWWYYAEKLRKEKYNLDENELKPYFKLENVRDGMFYLSNKLYGITFTQLNNIPTYLPEVEVFEVNESNGDHIGLLYLDYFPRPGKGQGAWCSMLRDGGADINGNKIHPIVTITCNFTEPTNDLPALLTFDETETLFHEFGHALQGLFSYSPYSRLSADIPRDMIELPSQILENWCSEPEMLKVYAKHYKTDEAIPDALIKKIQNTSTFNTGFNTTELLAATLLDLAWHNKSMVDDHNVNTFEKDIMTKYGLIPEILPRYRSTYFGHIFSSDAYAAGYYVYTWAEVLDKDAYQAFVDSGDLFNQDLAAKFRKYILTECGNDEAMKQYYNFRGQEPSSIPYMKARGLMR
ncbi:M3 family metallopeptidase [Odoribacter sp. OttesenSCG-928-L07]|nr:M3 family metallopeptidase [Odoribacter sp. OttesenSCG-928-L07]MDL2240356.1 M3 family metallopeptidase [Bacteroidales bacterium OttesenSCG-928-K22]